MSDLGEILKRGKSHIDSTLRCGLAELENVRYYKEDIRVLAAQMAEHIKNKHGLRVTVNFAYVQCDFAREDVDYASVEIWRKSDDGESELLYECEEAPFDEDAAQKIDDACRNYLVNIRRKKG